MSEDLYGIRQPDLRDYRELIQWWRTIGQNIDQTLVAGPGAVPFVTLKRPSGWALGLCRELIHDSARPFVWDVAITGYPALTGRTTFQLRWTKGSEVLTSDPIAITATRSQLARALPDELPEAYCYGGRMRASEQSGEAAAEYDTGRFWIAFAEDPVWVPEVIGLTSDRLAGFARRTHLRPAPEAREVFTLASTDGPTPVHPGALGCAFSVGARMCMLYHEPRIYQATLEAATTAGINWSLGPFQQEVVEGETATVKITLSVDAVSTLTDTTNTSIDLALDEGTTGGSDYTGTLADWITAAVAGSDVFSFDGSNRLTATLTADGPTLMELELLIPTVDDGTLEGIQSLAVTASNPLTTEGSVAISLDRAEVNIRDNDSIRWDITGPAGSSPGDTETIKLSVSGVFSEGLFTSIDLARTGTVADENTTDWEDALETAIAARDEATYAGGTLTITAQEDGAIAAIEFDVGFDANADGTWTLTASNGGASGGLEVEIGSDEVSIEVSP